jgi:uncharacterized membrane protein
MSTAVISRRLEFHSLADAALKAATRFWFGVAVIGQSIFFFAVASFYGITAVRGNWQAWNKFMTQGFTPGKPLGNFVVGMHVFSAAIIILAGMLQLIPQIRSRFPIFHRWLGRVYVVTAFTLSGAGLYMLWFRGTVGNASQHLGSTLNAVLIMLCAVMAMRYAMLRDFKTHRRWALRLYLVVSASLFIRVGIFLATFLNRGPFGFDPVTFTGPYLTFVSFAQYLVPLGVLELYLHAQEHPGAAQRFAVAALLFVLTLGMGTGIAVVSMAAWIPAVKAAYDPRISIAQTLSDTIRSSSVDQAVTQYRDLKTTKPTAYNFDEVELNNLGYQLIKAGQLQQAIRIFQLNVEAYPNSSNAYDSLGEAYMDAGEKSLAISNYQKSLQLNPKNHGAVLMLQKLNAQ